MTPPCYGFFAGAEFEKSEDLTVGVPELCQDTREEREDPLGNPETVHLSSLFLVMWIWIRVQYDADLDPCGV